MSVITSAGCAGSAVACLMAAQSGPMLALVGFLGGGTLGGMLGALTVAALGWGRA